MLTKIINQQWFHHSIQMAQCVRLKRIISKDGRVIGKMAHSERQGENRFKNIYGEMDQLIFEAGVKYFKGGN